MAVQTSAKRRRPLNQQEATTCVLVGVGMFLAAFGPEVAAAPSFAALLTPAFVGKGMVQLAGVITALYGAKKLHP